MIRKKILISGGDGNFAKEIKKQNIVHNVFAPTKADMNICNYQEVVSQIRVFKPDIFLHAAALTRPMVRHTDDPRLSISTNIIGTSNVCLACMNSNTKLIYISTDYVYPGLYGNYKETDSLSPINYYGWSKLGGECAVMLYPNSLILRMCMTERPFVHKKALVDSKKSLMYIDEAARITLKLLDEKGIINVGGPPTNSYDFARVDNPNIGKIYRKDISEKMAADSTMDATKLRRILDEN